MSKMAEDKQQLELPFETGERLPPRAAARLSAQQVRSAVNALRAAHVRKSQAEQYAKVHPAAKQG